MKNILIVSILAFALLASGAKAAVVCHDADVYSEYGDWSIVNPASYGHDNDWDSAAYDFENVSAGFIEANYTYNGQAGAYWEVRDYGGRTNLSVANCQITDGNLLFKMESFWDTVTAYSAWYCWNSSSEWENLRNDTSNNGIFEEQLCYEAPIVGTNIYDCAAVTSPGSYNLMNNLSIVTPIGDLCLNIQASDVDIDMNGYSITCGGYYTAVGVAFANRTTYDNLTVHDGIVEAGCGQTGVVNTNRLYNMYFQSPVAPIQMIDQNFDFENITIIGNQAYGIIIDNATGQGRNIFISGDPNYFTLGASSYDCYFCNSTDTQTADSGTNNTVTQSACPSVTTTTTTVPPTTTTTYPTGYIPLITGTGIPGIIISAAILIGLIAFLFGGELKLTPTDVAKGLIAALIMVSLIAALSGMW